MSRTAPKKKIRTKEEKRKNHHWDLCSYISPPLDYILAGETWGSEEIQRNQMKKGKLWEKSIIYSKLREIWGELDEIKEIVRKIEVYVKFKQFKGKWGKL